MTSGRINDKNNLVPDKTIAVVLKDDFPYEKVPLVLEPLAGKKKRDWFTNDFYRCLPLTIGNQYGFIVKAPYTFAVHWTGESETSATTIVYKDDVSKHLVNGKLPLTIGSHFGHGIFTVGLPMHFRTPPEINLMTINPPNTILPNVTAMTGVVETDNLSYPFSFNLKLQMPGLMTEIRAGTPIAAFIPIPRYFADKFSLVNALDIFPEGVVLEDSTEAENRSKDRDARKETTSPFDKKYLTGVDLYGNPYDNHQK